MDFKEGNVTADLNFAGQKPLQPINGKIRDGWTRNDRELYLALGMELPVMKGSGGIPEIRAGSTCPKCGQTQLEYNGLLNLACKNCGYSLGGCFT